MQQDKSSTNNMNMQLHDTFWRDDQVMVIFHSKLPLIENGVLSKEQVLNDLNLREQIIFSIRVLILKGALARSVPLFMPLLRSSKDHHQILVMYPQR